MKLPFFIIFLFLTVLFSCKKPEVDTNQEFFGWQVIRKEDALFDLELSKSGSKIFLLEPFFRINISEDNGASWENSFTNIDYYLSTSLAINEDKISMVAAEKGKIAISTQGEINGSNFWYSVDLDTAFNNLSVYNFDNHYWVLGTNSIRSKIYHLVFPSHTFLTSYINVPNLKKVKFIDSQYGWIFGENYIFHSNNSGYSWSEQLFMENTEFTSIDFLDLNNGWICTENGEILSTTNKGETWETIYSSPDYNFYSIEFINENKGWVGGYDKKNNDSDFGGILLYTEDGGMTWLKHPMKVEVIYEIVFVDENNGFALGNFSLMQTKTGGH
ncbi:MAG: hypothetical protein JXR58_07095 [Bacteroidales bacterium]|nr:hypothetical protein [Bacteroidales bacterium]